MARPQSTSASGGCCPSPPASDEESLPNWLGRGQRTTHAEASRPISSLACPSASPVFDSNAQTAQPCRLSREGTGTRSFSSEVSPWSLCSGLCSDWTWKGHLWCFFSPLDPGERGSEIYRAVQSTAQQRVFENSG